MPATSDRISLPDTPLELRRLYGQVVSYGVLWRLVVEGAVPAERVRGRWFVARNDLPLVAEALGIPATAEARA